MKKIILILFLLSIKIYASDSLSKVLVGNINFNNNIKLDRMEALEAVKYALLLSGKFTITTDDEIAAANKNIQNSAVLDFNPINVANECNAEELLFLGINQFQNMLRVDAAFVNVADTSIRKMGFGYELLHLRDKKTDEPVILPSLVKAAQKAIAGAIDSNLYQNVTEEAYQVKPQFSLAIGGIDYHNSDTLELWDLFEKKVISSYDAVENIFEAVYHTKQYAVYDIETRDSIYALFGFYGVENYKSPTNIEVETLRKFQVDYIITGKITRIPDGAEIKLYLVRIQEDSYIIENEAKTLLLHDSQEEFGLTLKFITTKLLGIM